jgi:predicted dehydrogenase
MVGGGPGAFIGAVHRQAAALDGLTELVAGAFSSSPEKSRQQGKELCLSPGRVYGSYKEMAAKEAALPSDQRIDFVAIVSPNHTHFDICKTFIEAGFHIVCDKPMTMTVAEAEELCRLVAKSGIVFALTHNYTGYLCIKQARELVRNGELGDIRKVVAEYAQGWLSLFREGEGNKQAVWRTDPAQAGVSSCVGDIGVHAANLVEYVTGLQMESVCADITTFIKGRQLEDDANCLVRYQGGAKGLLFASQISIGEENNLHLRVYGSKASLDWRQEDPHYLHVKYLDAPKKVYRPGNSYLADIVQHNTRLPFGHPEAFIEAFANIYRNAVRTMSALIAGEDPGEFDTDFPTVQDGARGVHFIHKAIESGKAGGKWVNVSYTPPGI